MTDGRSDGDLDWRITEAVEAALDRSAAVDVAALARRLETEEHRVRRCLRAVQALRGAADPASAFFVDAPDLAPPKLPADYELKGEIGRGGMGIVYRARQRSLGRDLAVKVLRPGDLLFGETIRRFRSEARSLARLRHPHIVSVHEVGEADGLVYFTMDLIDGRSLAEVLRERGSLTPTEVVRILRQITGAMDYAHGHGVIHRDLKPGNVLISEDRDAHVVDFGLALDVTDETTHTRTGQILGTPAYMSPEQAEGRRAEVGEGADIYALGAILYECLTGRAPFAGLGLAETIHAVVHRDPERPRKIAPRVHPDLEAICLKALEKRPERRYATARALLEDLGRFESGDAVVARRLGPVLRATRFLSRHRQVLAAAVVSLVFAIAIFAFVVAPRLGRTADDVLRSAVAFARDGKIRTAVDVARGGRPDPDDDPELVRTFDERLLPWHRRLAADAEAAGRDVEAREHQTAVAEILERRRQSLPDRASAIPGPEEVAVLWELAHARLAAGDAARADDVLARLRQALATPATSSGKRDPSRRRSVDEPRQLRIAPVELLDRLEPFLLEPTRPGHELARATFLDALGGADPAVAIGWLGGRGRQAVPLLMSLLGDGRVGHDAARLSDLALAIANGGGGTPLARALRARSGDGGDSAALLALVADLPTTEPAGTRALWDEIAARGRDEGVRVRIERALVEVAGGDEAAGDWLGHWAGRAAQDERRVAAWWRDRRDRSPRVWLAADAGVAPDAHADVILGELARSSGAKRALLHELLRLAVDDDVAVPVWPGRAPEPPGLIAAWHRALADEDARFVLRAAFFLRPPGEEPRIFGELTARVRAGESVDLHATGAFDAGIPGSWGLHAPGFAGKWEGFGNRVAPLHWTLDRRVVASWEGSRLVVRVDGLVIGEFGWTAAGDAMQPVGGAGGIGHDLRPTWFSPLGSRRDAIDPVFWRRTELLVAVEGPDAAATPWTVSDWQAYVERRHLPSLLGLPRDAEGTSSLGTWLDSALVVVALALLVLGARGLRRQRKRWRRIRYVGATWALFASGLLLACASPAWRPVAVLMNGAGLIVMGLATRAYGRVLGVRFARVAAALFALAAVAHTTEVLLGLPVLRGARAVCAALGLAAVPLMVLASLNTRHAWRHEMVKVARGLVIANAVFILLMLGPAAWAEGSVLALASFDPQLVILLVQVQIAASLGFGALQPSPEQLMRKKRRQTAFLARLRAALREQAAVVAD